MGSINGKTISFGSLGDRKLYSAPISRHAIAFVSGIFSLVRHDLARYRVCKISLFPPSDVRMVSFLLWKRTSRPPLTHQKRNPFTPPGPRGGMGRWPRADGPGLTDACLDLDNIKSIGKILACTTCRLFILATTQSVRLGLSFASVRGKYCRSFPTPLPPSRPFELRALWICGPPFFSPRVSPWY